PRQPCRLRPWPLPHGAADALIRQARFRYAPETPPRTDPMAATLFQNARIVDGTAPERGDPVSVLVEGGLIREVGRNLRADKAKAIDLKGRTLMPGLIDAHVHVIASLADLGRNAALPDSLVAVRSLAIMRAMLLRGFTTVRDVGGADFGLKQATEESDFPTPR